VDRFPDAWTFNRICNGSYRPGLGHVIGQGRDGGRLLPLLLPLLPAFVLLLLLVLFVVFVRFFLLLLVLLVLPVAPQAQGQGER
jgi:hypothetical protein